MRVIDLFCGSGGISLGFQMAGHEVVYGLDNNRDAIETFRRNFPGAKVDCRKIEDFDITELPESDIIVGGPPCVNFSMAKGSRANVLEGVKLVQAFMRVVHYRKPKYWIMENVPRIGLHLPEKIPLRWIGIDEDGIFEIPVRQEFDVRSYGAPQKRKRLLLGSYPVPVETHHSTSSESLSFSTGLRKTLTLGDIVNALPDPKVPGTSGRVTDPNYGIEIPVNQLTDHFMDTEMSLAESESIRLAKTQHPYMGRMDFPDDLAKPARTVVSLQMGRETLVLRSSTNRFRRATVRECATLQTFPLTFQFSGTTVNSRYKQAGNAVPPVLTYRIAEAITLIESGSVMESPKILFPAPFPKPSQSRSSVERSPNFRSGRIVRIPRKEVRGTRIELCSDGFPVVRWNVTLHLGEGKANHTEVQFDLAKAFEMVESTLQRNASDDVQIRFRTLVQQVAELDLPSGQKFHMDLHLGRNESPIIRQIEQVLDSQFPPGLFSGVDVVIAKPLEGLTKSKLRLRVLVMIPVLKQVEARLNDPRPLEGAAVQHLVQPDSALWHAI